MHIMTYEKESAILIRLSKLERKLLRDGADAEGVKVTTFVLEAIRHYLEYRKHACIRCNRPLKP